MIVERCRRRNKLAARDGERRPEIRVGTSSVTVDSARNKKKEEKGKICDVDVDSQKLCSQTSKSSRLCGNNTAPVDGLIRRPDLPATSSQKWGPALIGGPGSGTSHDYIHVDRSPNPSTER